MSDFFQKLFAFKFKWIGNLFHKANKPFLQAAIDITNTLKKVLSSGFVDIATGLIPGNIDDKIVALLREKVPVLLADELLIQTSGYPATKEAAQELAVKIIDSFGKLDDARKGRLYTSIAADIYIFLQQHVHGEKVTFGQAATLAESFYQDWLDAKEQ